MDPLEDPEIQKQIKIQEENDAKYQLQLNKIKLLNPKFSDDDVIEHVRKYQINQDEFKIKILNENKNKESDQKLSNEEINKNKTITEIRRLTEMSRVPDLILISGLSPPETEIYFGKELDDHCILLESTPKLQDKAMRLVLSIGCEVVIVDSEMSACLKKISLTPKDLITSDESNEVFGNFGIQLDNGEDEEEEE